MHRQDGFFLRSKLFRVEESYVLKKSLTRSKLFALEKYSGTNSSLMNRINNSIYNYKMPTDNRLIATCERLQ